MFSERGFIKDHTILKNGYNIIHIFLTEEMGKKNSVSFMRTGQGNEFNEF